MCGIMAYLGQADAKERVLQGLYALEYRGYDSAGLALRQASSEPYIIRSCGKVQELAEKLQAVDFPATLGLGHTRWATHGPATERNCHPHQSGRVLLVHNGIIENYLELRKDLQAQGYHFSSDTDSEVVAALIDSHYGGDARQALERSLPLLRGSYALAIHFLDQPDALYCAKQASSLVLTEADGLLAASSDILGTAPVSRQFVAMPEQSYARLAEGRIQLYQLGGAELTPLWQEISWDLEQVQKQGHEYFMHKEIHETPDALERSIQPHLYQGGLDLKLSPSLDLSTVKELLIVACGTALHAGMVARHWFEQKLGLPCRTEIASEFRYSPALLSEHCLVLAISQSGETADTLAALRLAREKGARTLAIVNVKASALAQEADAVLYTHAGPEIAVASTKAYSVQLAALYMLTLAIAQAQSLLSPDELAQALGDLRQLPARLRAQLSDEGPYSELGRWLGSKRDAFFIGRGLDYAAAMEASIKLKEISYIHSEAYAAGELKHGTLSLIEEACPVIALASVAQLQEKMRANICEVKSRGAQVLLIADGQFPEAEELADYQLVLAELPADLRIFSLALHLQFLAYHTARNKGLDVDQPRNLAKSVTVE